MAKKKNHPKIIFSELVDAVIEEFKGTNATTINIDALLLLASAREEAGRYSLSSNELKLSIEKYLGDDFNEDDLILVKAASYACQVVANHCFVKEFDENVEVLIEIDWVLNKSTGDYFATVKKKEGQ